VVIQAQGIASWAEAGVRTIEVLAKLLIAAPMSSPRALVYVVAITTEAVQLEKLIARGTDARIRTWKIAAHLLAAPVVHQALVHILAALAIGTQLESLAAGASPSSATQADLLTAIVVHLAQILGQTGVLLDQVKSLGAQALVATRSVLAAVTAQVRILGTLVDVLAAEHLTPVANGTDATEAGVILAVQTASRQALLDSVVLGAGGLLH